MYYRLKPLIYKHTQAQTSNYYHPTHQNVNVLSLCALPVDKTAFFKVIPSMYYR